MNFLAFLFFLVVAFYFIWNSKGSGDKSEMAGIGKMLIGVFVSIIIMGFVFKGLLAMFPGLTHHTARNLMNELGASFLAVWGMKFLIVAISTIFSRIMSFHKKYNADNYKKFSPFTNKLAPGLLVLAKCIVSLASILIFYGIWFTH